MTSHAFARQLLRGPDLPIFHPTVIKYDQEESPLHDPVVEQHKSLNNVTEQEEDVLLISYKDS